MISSPVAPPSRLRRATATYHCHSGAVVVADAAIGGVSIELHEGQPATALRVETGDSSWLFLAAHATCRVEVLGRCVLLMAGMVLLLPAGQSAVMRGDDVARWVALRLPACRPAELKYCEHRTLTRLTTELALDLRQRATAAEHERCRRLTARLRRECAHFGEHRAAGFAPARLRDASFARRLRAGNWERGTIT